MVSLRKKISNHLENKTPSWETKTYSYIQTAIYKLMIYWISHASKNRYLHAPFDNQPAFTSSGIKLFSWIDRYSPKIESMLQWAIYSLDQKTVSVGHSAFLRPKHQQTLVVGILAISKKTGLKQIDNNTLKCSTFHFDHMHLFALDHSKLDRLHLTPAKVRIF